MRRVPATSGRIVRRWRQRIDAAPEQVFPLLCPVREREWLDGWQCIVLHSASGVAEAGCVFVTDHPTGGRTIWTCTEYEPPRRIAYFRVTPSVTADHLCLDMKAAGGGDGTTVDVEYTWTPLSPAGAEYAIQAAAADRWREMMQFWERALNHFLRTGEMLLRSSVNP